MSDADRPPPADTADPSALAAQMLADLQRSNPQLALLAQMMQARTIVPQPPSEDLSEEVTELATRLAEAEARIEAMKRQGRRLYDSYQRVQTRQAELAAALGACGLCWGEDEHCPSCRGRGRPGMVRADEALRDRLLGAMAPPMQQSAAVQPDLNAH